MEHGDIEIGVKRSWTDAVLKAETEIKDLTNQSCPGVARRNLFSAVDSVMVTQRFSKTLRISLSYFVGNG
jgi:hypothetical protein